MLCSRHLGSTSRGTPVSLRVGAEQVGLENLLRRINAGKASIPGNALFHNGAEFCRDISSRIQGLVLRVQGLGFRSTLSNDANLCSEVCCRES